MDVDTARAIAESLDQLPPHQLRFAAVGLGSSSSGERRQGRLRRIVDDPPSGSSASASRAATWDACTAESLQRGELRDGKLVVSEADLSAILAAAWAVPLARASALLREESLPGLGPQAQVWAAPGFLDLAFLPGLVCCGRVKGRMIGAVEWDAFLQQAVAAGPRSRRGTALASAASQQPKGRSSARRAPEAAYSQAALPVVQADAAAAAPRKRKARDPMVAHRAGKKQRNISHRDQHADVLSSVSEDEPAAAVVGKAGGRGNAPPPYTRARAAEVDSRGRRPGPAWGGKSGYVAARELDLLDALKLGELLLAKNILPDRRGEPCSRTLKTGAACPGSLQLRGRDGSPVFRCCGRGSCQTFVRLTDGSEDVFPDGYPLRVQMLLLWHFCSFMDEPVPSRVGQMLGVWPRAVRARFDRFRDLLEAHVERALETAQLGGWNSRAKFPHEVEMDEVLVRSRAEVVAGGSTMIRTVRYCGLLERGHPASLQLIKLPDRLVQAGGGGPISNEELLQVLTQPSGAFRIRPRTVIHTDSARAYFNLGWRAPRPAEGAGAPDGQEAAAKRERQRVQELPEDAPLVALAQDAGGEPPRRQEFPRQQEPEWAARYRQQKWVHTAVVHSKKPGRSRQFAPSRKLRFPTGREGTAAGGTQAIDGHWRSLKRAVTRSAVNTRRRGRLHSMVLSHLWRHWTQGSCRFTAFGQVLADHRARRADPSPEEARRAAAFLKQRVAQRQAASSARKFVRAAAARARAKAREAVQRSSEARPSSPRPTWAAPRPSSAPRHPRDDPVRSLRSPHAPPPQPGRRVVPVTAAERASVELSRS